MLQLTLLQLLFAAIIILANFSDLERIAKKFIVLAKINIALVETPQNRRGLVLLYFFLFNNTPLYGQPQVQVRKQVMRFTR